MFLIGEFLYNFFYPLSYLHNFAYTFSSELRICKSITSARHICEYTPNVNLFSVKVTTHKIERLDVCDDLHLYVSGAHYFPLLGKYCWSPLAGKSHLDSICKNVTSIRWKISSCSQISGNIDVTSWKNCKSSCLANSETNVVLSYTDSIWQAFFFRRELLTYL